MLSPAPVQTDRARPVIWIWFALRKLQPCSRTRSLPMLLGPLTAAFRRSEWWRYAMFGCLVGLIAVLALLSTEIGHPVRDVSELRRWSSCSGLRCQLHHGRLYVHWIPSRREAAEAWPSGPTENTYEHARSNRVCHRVCVVDRRRLGLHRVVQVNALEMGPFVAITVIVVGVVLRVRRGST